VLALVRIPREQDRFRVPAWSRIDHDIERVATMMPDPVIVDHPWSSDDIRWAPVRFS